MGETKRVGIIKSLTQLIIIPLNDTVNDRFQERSLANPSLNLSGRIELGVVLYQQSCMFAFR